MPDEILAICSCLDMAILKPAADYSFAVPITAQYDTPQPAWWHSVALADTPDGERAIRRYTCHRDNHFGLGFIPAWFAYQYITKWRDSYYKPQGVSLPSLGSLLYYAVSGWHDFIWFQDKNPYLARPPGDTIQPAVFLSDLSNIGVTLFPAPYLRIVEELQRLDRPLRETQSNMPTMGRDLRMVAAERMNVLSRMTEETMSLPSTYRSGSLYYSYGNTSHTHTTSASSSITAVDTYPTTPTTTNDNYDLFFSSEHESGDLADYHHHDPTPTLAPEPIVAKPITETKPAATQDEIDSQELEAVLL